MSTTLRLTSVDTPHERPAHERPAHERPAHERPAHERPVADELPYDHATAVANLDRMAKTANRERVLAALDARIPRKFAGAGLGSFDLAHVAGEDRARLERRLANARDYVAAWPTHRTDAAFPHLAVFCGAPGTGKTRLAWSIVRDVVRAHGVTVEVLDFPTVVDEIKAAWNRSRGEASSAALVAQYTTAELLVIDDVSDHAFYGDASKHLFALVKPREEDMRPVLITSNHTPDAFLQVAGKAVASRINGSGGTWDFGTVSRREWDADRREEGAR